METINLTGQDCPLKSKECIERIIAGYLSETKYIIRSLYCLGSKVRLELDYDDFLPEAKVREYLESNIPNLELTLKIISLATKITKIGKSHKYIL